MELQILSNRSLKDWQISAIKKVAPQANIVWPGKAESIERFLSETDVFLNIIGGKNITPEMWPQAQRLKWIHVGAAGVDDVLFRELVESPVVVTNCKGIHASTISEHVFAMMLAFARGLFKFQRDRQARKWDREGVSELGGKTLGILGLGGIGKEIARRGKCFGMKVIGMKRDTTKPVEFVDELITPDRLLQALPNMDYVVLSVPLTAETHGLIGQAQLAAMKPTAYLINVARGKVVDEAALIQALKNGTIAGAALDVFENEPLPENSELWDMQNVIFTPHVAGTFSANIERITEIFVENLRRFLNDEPMINVVNKKLGY
ncbi:MAG TPA: D-2-hydroxyacid dehydrogenase [Firmicutes bacterium]|nr:D-2-hydroxyacid dehydrogenase [Bacillota bacterium]